MSIKAVVFDMDGILFDTERLFSECLVDVSADDGWGLDWDVVLECVGTSYEETEHIIMNHMGDDYPYNKLRDRALENFRAYVKANGMPFKNGVHRLFDWLDKIHIPFGLATTTQRISVDEALSLGGIRERFSSIVCGDEVEKGKPDPEIYHKAAQEMGFGAENCIVFEDSSNGITAAATAGARVVWIPDLQHIPDEIRTRCFSEVGSLDAVCDRWRELVE